MLILLFESLFSFVLLLFSLVFFSLLMNLIFTFLLSCLIIYLSFTKLTKEIYSLFRLLSFIFLFSKLSLELLSIIVEVKNDILSILKLISSSYPLNS